MSNDNYLKEYMHRLSLSIVSLLELMKIVNERDTDGAKKSKINFLKASSLLIDNFKNQTENTNFDISVFIKKTFNFLKNDNNSKMLKEKNYDLFNVRNEEKQIVTIIDGIDLRVGYKLLTDEERTNFWQYLYLYCCSVLNIIRLNNPEKFAKYGKVVETLNYVESEIKKTGINFANKIFNPFLGLLKENDNFDLDSLSKDNKLGENTDGSNNAQSLDFLLNMVGINNIIDESKLKEGLKDLGEEQISEASHMLSQILGGGDDKEMTDVCNDLLGGLLTGLKKDGLNSKTAENIFDKTKGIDKKQMDKMGAGIMNFLNDGENKLKSMKDKKGNNIINDEVLESMKQPLSMLKNIMGGGGENKNMNGDMMGNVMGMLKNMMNKDGNNDMKKLD